MKLPCARGPLSEGFLQFVTRNRCRLPEAYADPAAILFDHDAQLSLFLAREMHFSGLEDVDPELEWEPAVERFRASLESSMLEALERAVGPPAPCPADALPGAIRELVEVDEEPALSRFLGSQADARQFREFVIHRSAYQLKEADPHTFTLPRVRGPAKAAMVEIQADEYGGGRFERMHSELFAKTMRALGLDPSYGAYIDRIPATTLASVNLISLFSLHRRWRGASVGHLAAFEITSPQPNRRYARGLRRLGFGPAATEFYDEHVEADSVHENIALYDLAQALARDEPELGGDIMFGVRCLLYCEDRFATHLLEAWRAGESSLLESSAVVVS
jgi:Iron-containing redox enzyme